jgi:hypothetical protein
MFAVAKIPSQGPGPPVRSPSQQLRYSDVKSEAEPSAITCIPACFREARTPGPGRPRGAMVATRNRQAARELPRLGSWAPALAVVCRRVVGQSVCEVYVLLTDDC